MNPTAIYSKSGKGVQEASGKTSLLQRGDRVVLAAIDGRATLGEVAQKVGKPFDAAFQSLISQLDKNGFVREVSSGAAPAKPAVSPASRPPAAKPAARPAGQDGGGDLDFSSLGKASSPRPAAKPTPSPMEQTSALAKAREEAEAKAAADRERLKKDAETKARIEMEAKARAEAEARVKADEAKAKADAEAKIKAAREAAVRAAAEAKARAEADAKVRIEAERKAREETERRLEAERKAREEAEKRAREEAERARKEAEEKARREAEELRQRLEAERKAREEAERKAKEEAEQRKRLEAERQRAEQERVEREQAERAQAERDRREQEEEESKRRAEEQALADAAAAAAAAVASVEVVPAPKPAAKPESFADSLLADLDNFSNREDEERKARDEADGRGRAVAAAARAGDAAERKAKEKQEAERRRDDEEARQRAEEEERRLAEDARRVREEEERRAAQEEERRKREAEEIRRKAEAATAAAMAKEGRSAPKDEDIPIRDEDSDMDEVLREQADLDRSRPKAKDKKKPAEKSRPAKVAAARTPRKPLKLGKPIVMTLIAMLVVAIGVAHVMPIGTADYEQLASKALGRPVKIGSANLWLFSGLPEVRFKDVRVGGARIAQVKASGSPFSIFGERKGFSTIEVDGLSLSQDVLADALFATVRADNFRVDRLVIKNLDLPGPATLPKGLTAEVLLNARGAMSSAVLGGPDNLHAKLLPKVRSVDFEDVAGGFPLPIGLRITLSNFGMKGTATPRGMTINEWGGALYNGGISGRASVRWGGGWQIDGILTVRNINAAVFAPALLSAGNGEGTAKFSMSAPDAASLATGGRLDGNFTVSKGTLGSFDLARAIQSNGKQANGTTQFAEMNGQAIYDRGVLALRNVTIGAGALNAGASADISQNGALSGRIIADMKTASRMLSATLLLGGTVKEPQVRN